jgi:hypothetical protein
MRCPPRLAIPGPLDVRLSSLRCGASPVCRVPAQRAQAPELGYAGGLEPRLRDFRCVLP